MSDTPQAGWYPDPEDSTQQRYWDGQQWTDHRAPLSGGEQPASSTPSYEAGQQPAWGGGGQQPSYGGYGAVGQGAAAGVNTWLWQSIVATLFCCLPAGVVGIVFAAQANSAKNMGDVATAQEKARLAKIWTLVSVGVGLVFIVLFLVLGVFGAMTEFQQQPGF